MKLNVLSGPQARLVLTARDNRLTPTQEEYDNFVAILPRQMVGVLELGSDERSQAVANRLTRAARRRGVKLKVWTAPSTPGHVYFAEVETGRRTGQG